MKLAARFMSALLVASLVLPSLLAAPVAASGSTDHFTILGLAASETAGVADTITVEARDNLDALDTTFAGTISFTSSDGSAVLPADGQSLTNGSGSFQVEFRTAGSRSVTVTEDGDTPTGTDSTTVSAAAATLFVVAGFPDTTAGVSHSFSVTAKDQFNNTDTAYAGLVDFTSNDGTATLPADNQTLTNGTDTFSATLKLAGVKFITADDGSITGSQGSIVVTAAAADHLSVGGFTSPTTAGASHTVTVTARDPFSNVDSGYTGTVHITSSDPGATLPSNHGYIVSDGGTHGFTVTLNTAGTRSITATDVGTPSINGIQGSITVNTGPAEHLAVTGFADPTVAGVAHTFTVTAQDVGNNTDTTYTGTVTFTSSDGAATLPGDYTFVGGDNGTHTFTLGGALQTSGVQSITATDGSITGSQTGIAVTPAAATHLSLTTLYPASTVAGVSHNVVVTALDAFDNVATGYAGLVTVTATGGTTHVSPSAATALVNGVGTFGVIFDTVGTGRTIDAAGTGGVTSDSQTGIAVTPAAATHLSLTTLYPASTVAGVSHNVVVTALDAFDNVATGYAGLVTVTATGGTTHVSPSAATALVNGVGTFGVIFDTVGTGRTIDAAGTGGVTSDSQTGIAVTPAAATHLSLTTLYPASTVAGVSHNVVVTALDAFDNVATGYAGLVTVTATGGTTHVSPSAATALVNGVGTFGVIFDTVGTGRTIDAAGTGGVTSDSQTGIAVTPAAATHLSLTTLYPASTVAGVSHNVVVTALDAFDNVATGYAGLVTVTATGGTTHVSPSAATALVNGVGTFGVIFDTVGTGRTIDAAGTGGVTSDSQTGIAVTPAAATHLSLTTLYPASTVAGVSHNVVVTALDAFDNVATGYAGLVTVTATGGTTHVSPSAATALVNGVGTFGVIFDTVGTGRTIDAAGTGGVTSDSQTGIAVTPAAATHLSLTTLYPASTVAGVSHNVVVTALDAFDNVATGYAGLVTVTATGGTTHVSPSAATALVNGVGTFGVIFDTVGTGRTIDAAGTGGVTSDSQTGIAVTPAAATHLSLTTLYPASTVAGVSHNVVVTALDAFDNVATGYAGLVTVTATGGTTHVSPSAATALVNGVGTFGVIFDTVGTGRTIDAAGTGGVTSDSQTGIAVTPAAATHLSLTTLYPASTVAGVSHNVVVTALDAFDNVATGYAGLVTVTATGGTTHVSPSAATALVNGVGTFGVIFDTVGTGRTIDAAGTGGVTSDSQTGIAVTPAAATHLSLTTLYPASTVAGVSHNVVVTALDAFDNVATGYAGLVTVTATGGTTHVSPSAATALVNGVGTFGVIFDTVGTGRTIDAAGTGGVTSDSQTGIAVTPAAATHLSLTTLYPASTVAGVSHNVVVTALDAFDNVATGYAGLVTVTATGGTTHVSPSAATALVNGVGTFGVIFDTVGTGRTIDAAGTGGVTSDSQTGIAVTPAAATHLSLTTLYPASTVAGVSHNVVVTALDAFDNVATGYAGLVTVTATGGTTHVSPSAATALVNGVGTFGVIFDTVGTGRTIDAAGTGGVTSDSQTGIAVTPAAADVTTSLITASPTSVSVDVGSSTITVQLKDQFGNDLASSGGTVTLASTLGAFGLVADNSDGTYTATLPSTVAGTATVSGKLDGVDITDGETVTFTPGVATHFVVQGFPSSTVAGAAQGFTVIAHDQYHNVATGYAGTVTFTSTDPAPVLPADSTLTNGTGPFSATLTTVGTWSITATDTFSSTITGSQTNIDVTPAATDHFTVTGYPSPNLSDGVPHNVTVTALDVFDNLTPAYAGTVQITSSDGFATLPADNTLTNGVGAFSVTLNTSGNQSITATDSVTSSITGSQLNIAIDPGPVDHIVISPSTASILATDTQLYTAEGFDAGNNDLGDFTSVTDFSIVGGTCVLNECSAVGVGDHTVTGHQTIDDVSDTAVLTILNTDPVALDDTPPDILEDATATTIDVLSNDTDVNLDALTITGSTDGALGTVVVNGTGLDLAYTPNLDANGSDTFTYTVSDGNGGSHSATVHVTITPVNDAPTYTVGANQTIPEQTTVSPKTVLNFATAMNPGGSADEAAQVLSFTASNSANTLFAVQPSVDVSTGTLTYTPAVNRNGVATVTLTLHDDGGLLNGGVDATAHTFTITVTGSNHTPFAINDSFTVVQGSSTMALPVLTNDNASNPDVGEVLHIVNVTQGTAGGKVTITGGGTGLTYRPKTDYHGVDYFTYRVKDATLYSTYATVRISVPKDTYKPVATAPVQTIAAQTLGSSTVKIRLAWTGTDKGYGVSKFEVWQSVNGHSYTKIKTTSGHSTYVTATVGKNYRFRVRAIDKKSNIGSYAYGPKFAVYLAQETSGGIVYSVPWTTLNSSVYSGGHVRSTTNAGDDATFTTVARTITWVAAKGPARGTADVYVDGVLKAHINLNSSSALYKYVAYSFTFPTSIAHSMQIIYTGPITRRVDVDAFVFLR